ncbi:hypothetical protein DXG01_001168 [Tephrocybe rancida]|nr:hypothetical protein DXG01_001168 [Tephrocybe rancida]
MARIDPPLEKALPISPNEKEDSATANAHPEPQQDARFHTPPPSPLKRAALILFTLLLFWLAFSMKRSLWDANRDARIVYANRYSKEHKFRPAASPIITETMKDGRVRIRGAAPTAAPETTKAAKVKTRKGKTRGKKGRKGEKGKRKKVEKK